MQSLKDDYGAKFRLWIADPPSFKPPDPQGLPAFGWKRFDSYAELNAWKRDYRRAIARAGGVQWKR